MAAAKRRDLCLSNKVDILKQLELPGVMQGGLVFLPHKCHVYSKLSEKF